MIAERNWKNTASSSATQIVNQIKPHCETGGMFLIAWARVETIGEDLGYGALLSLIHQEGWKQTKSSGNRFRPSSGDTGGLVSK